MASSKTVIVTGSGGPAGLNFVSSLLDAPEKFELVCTDINKYHLEWIPVKNRFLLPRFDSPDYVDKINELVEKTGAEFIHAQPDGEVKVFSDNREKLKARLFYPSKETVRVCQDKSLSSRAWIKDGLLKHDAIRIDGEKDLDEAASVFGYPYWLRASVGFSSRGSTLVENKEMALHWIGYWQARKVGWKFIAQEYFPGKNIAFQSLWKDGELVMSQARERLEYLYPYLAPSGVTNTPVVAVTINRDDINKAATDAVTSIDRHASGIFCVDLKEDKQGIIRPTEINVGRFFTTSYFFAKAGINMPYYYVKLAYGEEIPEFPKYNILPDGMYWIRHIDAPAVLVREGEWEHRSI